MIGPPPPEEVVNRTENCHSAHNQDAVIHSCSIHLLRRRPKHKDLNDEQIDASEEVDGGAQQTGYPPRAPEQFTGAAW